MNMSLLKNRTLRKTLMLLGALILCVMNGACLTMQLYQGKKSPLHEQISAFLLNPEQQQIVFVGKSHHYIFPLSNDLRQILSWSGRGQIVASQLHFTMSKNNSIRGSYNLLVPDASILTREDQQTLRSYGFVAQPSGFFYHGQFSHGTAYDACKFALPQAVMLTTPLELNINYDYASTGQIIGRTLLTPLSVAADGVTTVIGVVVLLPVFLVAESTNHSGH